MNAQRVISRHAHATADSCKVELSKSYCNFREKASRLPRLSQERIAKFVTTFVRQYKQPQK
jgi:hypothetical protein